MLDVLAVSDIALIRAYRAARRATEEICRPLAMEDLVVQVSEEASPPKWHLAHTTWFFETFLLLRYLNGYLPFDGNFAFLFNSYYESAGPRSEKGLRGRYSRPVLERVHAYRRTVDEGIGSLLASPSGSEAGVESLVRLGIQHEQQHQELLLTDIKSILHFNPDRPAYGPEAAAPHPRPARSASAGPDWTGFGPGLRGIGWGGDGFSFDNEMPRHSEYVPAFRLGNRLATNGEYLAFVRDGGYGRPEFWLSDGWRRVRTEGWTAPLYWEGGDADPREYTLAGLRPLDPDSPVCHVSYYEADAFARWSGARLPTEAEWETACLAGAGALEQMEGELWQWTASAYLPYPGFRTLPGAVGEYNGKFMLDQMVLRGGSCASPSGHVRPTYRNFFPAGTRWQFSGIRLAEDA